MGLYRAITAGGIALLVAHTVVKGRLVQKLSPLVSPTAVFCPHSEDVQQRIRRLALVCPVHVDISRAVFSDWIVPRLRYMAVLVELKRNRLPVCDVESGTAVSLLSISLTRCTDSVGGKNLPGNPSVWR